MNLLDTRYRVEADYPNNDIEVGTILTCLPNGTVTDFKVYDFTESESFFAKYPHLFRKLEWWEERPENEMPEYVNYYDRILKVVRHKPMHSTHTVFQVKDGVTVW